VTTRERHGANLTLVFTLGALLVPVAIAWLTGVVAGVLATGRPVTVTLGAAAAVAVHIPGHLSNVRGAWPTHDQPGLPGELIMVPVLAVCAAVVLTVVALAVALLARHLHRGDRDRAARWADTDELAPLAATGPQYGRVTLGHHNGRLVLAERRASVLLVGPAQSGKTTGLVVPVILEWQGPVLSTSVKADVVHDTRLARSSGGPVLIFDPTGCTGLQHTPWSPLAAAHRWEGARRTAANLLSVGEQAAGHSPDEAFWRPAGSRHLAPLLLAAAHGNKTMNDVLRWVNAQDEREPTELLRDCTDPAAIGGLEALQSVWDADPRFRSNLTQTIAVALDAWDEPRIARATAGENQIDAARLLDEQSTLYLVAPAHEQRRLRGLFTALVAAVTAAAFERSALTGMPLDPPLLLALDEVANIAPLGNLDEIASTGPGQGVQLVTVIQNISQAMDRWGHDRAETIIANHRARLFASGIGDRATLEYLTHTLGEEEVSRVSTTRQTALAGGSHTYSSDFRSLAAPHRVRQAASDSALLVYGNLAPAWLTLRPWYRDEQLTALVTTGSPAHPSTTRHASGISAARHTLKWLAATGEAAVRGATTTRTTAPPAGPVEADAPQP
jgi:type IV secretion system protein VirD4